MLIVTNNSNDENEVVDCASGDQCSRKSVALMMNNWVENYEGGGSRGGLAM